NDLLIYVQLMDGFYYPIAIQSKKISSDGNYHAFKGEYEQLKKLKQFSTENGYIPMYLLYNFIDKHSRTFSMCGIKFEWNQFGCTLVNLSDVEEVCIKTKKKTGKEYLRLPHFDDFHPAYAHPFFKLVCCENVLTGIDNFKKEFRNKLQYEIKSVQLTELQSSNYWRKLSLREQHRDMYQTTSENSRKDFAPRFRFIFSNSWLKK
ncbi:MAG: hypothetical protein KGZ58_12010, partial [Ignavibacteriales bacterium]|nr:hypothetical protein [Ignavibacteriales bacterium]